MSQPKTTSLSKRIWQIARIVLLAVFLFLVILMFFENKLIFFPARYPEGDWSPQGIKVEDAWITTNDGVKIHGWYLPCDEPRAHVLVAHGNAGNITHRDDLMRAFQGRLRVDALFFDYRGYGRSEGSPDEPGILNDARAARKWLAEKVHCRESEIVLFGESIGCGVVVDLASKDDARGLVLENAFTSLPDVAANAMPLVPVRWLMRMRLNSLAKIGNYHGPLLQFHGTRDSIIPFGLGQKLHDAANQPKKFVSIPNGDHNDPRTRQFFEELESFLKSLATTRD